MLFRTGTALVVWLVAGTAIAQPARVSPPAPIGEWLVAKQVARIKIVDCEGRLWGVVAWEAKPGGLDNKNPDPTLRSRPTLGMPILLGMAQTKTNQWDGQIYNSQDGSYLLRQRQPGGYEHVACSGVFSRVLMWRRELDTR